MTEKSELVVSSYFGGRSKVIETIDVTDLSQEELDAFLRKKSKEMKSFKIKNLTKEGN